MPKAATDVSKPSGMIDILNGGAIFGHFTNGISPNGAAANGFMVTTMAGWAGGGTVGPMFYWYERPLYPYPDPYLPSGVVAPPTYVQQPELIPEAPPAAMVAPPPATNWYYCAKPEGYYPYVTACPGGWKIVPATPPAPKR